MSEQKPLILGANWGEDWSPLDFGDLGRMIAEGWTIGGEASVRRYATVHSPDGTIYQMKTTLNGSFIRKVPMQGVD